MKAKSSEVTIDDFWSIGQSAFPSTITSAENNEAIHTTNNNPKEPSHVFEKSVIVESQHLRGQTTLKSLNT